MTFRITRTSDWDFNLVPCDGCREVEVSGICMDGVTIHKNKVWVKEINTLEELMDIANTVKNDLIIKLENKDAWLKPTFPEIEIYDTYRE